MPVSVTLSWEEYQALVGADKGKAAVKEYRDIFVAGVRDALASERADMYAQRFAAQMIKCADAAFEKLDSQGRGGTRSLP